MVFVLLVVVLMVVFVVLVVFVVVVLVVFVVSDEDFVSYSGVVIFLMVGICYLQLESGVFVFIIVGVQVVEGQIILIIEVMKIMNQIFVFKVGIIK